MTQEEEIAYVYSRMCLAYIVCNEEEAEAWKAQLEQLRKGAQA